MSKTARLLFVAVYLLITIGVVITYSASAIYAEQYYGNAQHFLIRQALFVLIGTFVLFAAASIPITGWRKQSKKLILVSIALLLLVFLPGIGHTAGGAKRWIRLVFFNFQPIEFAKVMICVYMADYLARKMKTIRRGGITIFVPPMILVFVVCVLAILQPDLGSCAFILTLTLVLFFISGIQLRYMIAAGVVFIPILYFLVIRVPYRLSRVTAYLNPWEDPQGSGFQMIQSFLAFGVGGVQGAGLGQSTQKLLYLPSAHNDFIFSILGEELGLLGLLAVVVLYAIIFVCGMLMVSRSSEPFEKLLCMALTLFFVMQALINMMVATGLLPTKGLPLPFISYGGTSMVVNLLAVGLMLSLDLHRRRAV